MAFFAGSWTRWTPVRKVREAPTTNDLFAFLTTEPNALVGTYHPKAMPVILTTQDEIDIWMDAPVKAPDGMRAAKGKLFVAENAGGKVDALTITGDTAHVTVLKAGLNTPTGIEPVGDTLWFTERGAGKVWSIPIPK